jgi:hypothetical protein
VRDTYKSSRPLCNTRGAGQPNDELSQPIFKGCKAHVADKHLVARCAAQGPLCVAPDDTHEEPPPPIMKTTLEELQLPQNLPVLYKYSLHLRMAGEPMLLLDLFSVEHFTVGQVLCVKIRRKPKKEKDHDV